jgi:hypothetical protein
MASPGSSSMFAGFRFPQESPNATLPVKWLLAIPQFVIVSVFIGGGLWLGSRGASAAGWGAGGLVGLLVLIAAIAVLFTGRYPGSLYRFVLGMGRWVLRVAAYAGPMTDHYPPFRLDQGGPDPGSVPGGLTPPPPGLPPAARPAPAAPVG